MNAETQKRNHLKSIEALRRYMESQTRFEFNDFVIVDTVTHKEVGKVSKKWGFENMALIKKMQALL